MTQLRARYANAERGIPSEADHCDLKVSPELCRFSPDGTEGATTAVAQHRDPDLEDHQGFACGEAESIAVDAGQIKSFRVRSLGVFVRRCRYAYVNEPAYRTL
jgi:hypothetical protein